MSFFKLTSILCLLPSFVFATPVAQEAQWQTATVSVPAAEPTACGDLIDDVNQGYYIFPALEAYECLSTVPFVEAVALRFIEYYNTTIQFQSTLAYLRDPPKSYQQPAVNVLAELEAIKKNVTAGFYKNQYEFEATVQSLVYRMHDAHVTLDAGVLSAFTFGGFYDIMSVSVDGKQPPRIYLKDDIIDSQGGKLYTPSPVVQLNGQDVVEYLTEFAALNAVGMLEPNADWNQLMYSPTQDIQGIYNTFGWDATFYPGDTLNYTLANSTILESEFVAFYTNPYQTGPLTTGGDFYNYFVLGLLPASYNGSDAGTAAVANDTAPTDYSVIGWSNVTAAYPSNPDIVQPDLSVTGGGFLTAYFMNDTSTGVISIPSFDQYGEFVGSFSKTVADFITRARELKVSRIVVDVQQNFGGTSILAIDTFRQFFPNTVQFAGSRRRSHHLANVLGGAMTRFWADLTPDNELYSFYKESLAANEWVVTDRLNAATGKNFSSWAEYYGPLTIHGDYFSLVERYDLSNPVFDAAAFDGWIPTGYEDGANTAQDSPPFAAKDIVILTDGICSSTCALFVEMMTYQAGVRTVTVGGRPQTGPMQAVSGSRGARSYDSSALDANFAFASLVNDTAGNLLPQDRDPNLYTNYAGINLRDEIRKNDSEPLQFKYEAANCRIYFTLANANNMSQLWHDAASATWDNPSLCVEGSTGYASTGNATAAKSPPAASNITVGYHASSATLSNIKVTPNGGLPDAQTRRTGGTIEACSSSCPGGCNSVTCPGGETALACLPACSNIGGPCSGDGRCIADSIIESKQRTAAGRTVTRQIVQGKCFPDFGTPSIGCPNTGVNTNDTPPS